MNDAERQKLQAISERLHSLLGSLKFEGTTAMYAALEEITADLDGLLEDS